MARMLREAAVLERMAVRKTKFKKDYVDSGRVRWVYSGRTKRLEESEVDRLIQEDVAKANVQNAPVKPALAREAYMRGAHTRRRIKSASNPTTDDETAPASS